MSLTSSRELTGLEASSATAPLQPTTEMVETYNQLNKIIDDLDIHIEEVVKKHEAQFLFAYRNHMKKIKKELAELKRRSQQQEKEFTSNDRIAFLEKQIAIFREEALKLYDKLEDRNKENEQLKMRLKDAEKENTAYQKEMKEMIRKLKAAEITVHGDSPMRQIHSVAPSSHNHSHARTDNNNNSSHSMAGQSKKRLCCVNKLPNIHSEVKAQTPYPLRPLQEILRPYLPKEAQLQEVVQQITDYVKQRDQEWQQRVQVQKRRTSMTATFMHGLGSNGDTDLKDWFLDCVKTIKREIYKRKQQDSSNLNFVNSIEQFLTVDKLRLLEMFLSNEKLLTHMYLKIFPDRFSELVDYLSKREKKVKELEGSVKPINGMLSQVKDRMMSNRESQVQDNVQGEPELQYELEEIQRPAFVTKKPKRKADLIRNKVVIKNGKLNISSM